jgi:hypothetical protein
VKLWVLITPRLRSSVPQDDPSHRAAADPLYAGEEFDATGHPAAAVMAHPAQDGGQPDAPPWACTSLATRTFPQPSQVILRNHDGKAGSGCARASVGERRGSGAVGTPDLPKRLLNAHHVPIKTLV